MISLYNAYHSEPSEEFYLLSEALPEDKELRLYLQRKRLVSHP